MIKTTIVLPEAPPSGWKKKMVNSKESRGHNPLMDFTYFSPPLSDVLFPHKICHLWDSEGHAGQHEQWPHALLPEGPAGSLRRCKNTHTHTLAVSPIQDCVPTRFLCQQVSLVGLLVRRQTWWTSGKMAWQLKFSLTYTQIINCLWLVFWPRHEHSKYWI